MTYYSVHDSELEQIQSSNDITALCTTFAVGMLSAWAESEKLTSRSAFTLLFGATVFGFAALYFYLRQRSLLKKIRSSSKDVRSVSTTEEANPGD